MKVLVACEFSGTVRDAFLRAGHDAMSADLLPSEAPGPHHLGDVRDILGDGWDLMVAHPPCTMLTKSGARWWAGRLDEQEAAIAFVLDLWYAPIERIAIENPPGKLGTAFRKADQTIQPWQFGHGETKATCFWLKNLPHLQPTLLVEGREPRVHFEAPGPDRWMRRSRTLSGIAAAMAEQWTTSMPMQADLYGATP